MASLRTEVVVEVRTLPAGRLAALESLETAVGRYLRSAPHTNDPRWHELHGAYVATREAS